MTRTAPSMGPCLVKVAGTALPAVLMSSQPAQHGRRMIVGEDES